MISKKAISRAIELALNDHNFNPAVNLLQRLNGGELVEKTYGPIPDNVSIESSGTSAASVSSKDGHITIRLPAGDADIVPGKHVHWFPGELKPMLPGEHTHQVSFMPPQRVNIRIETDTAERLGLLNHPTIEVSTGYRILDDFLRVDTASARHNADLRMQLENAIRTVENQVGQISTLVQMRDAETRRADAAERHIENRVSSVKVEAHKEVQEEKKRADKAEAELRLTREEVRQQRLALSLSREEASTQRLRAEGYKARTEELQSQLDVEVQRSADWKKVAMHRANDLEEQAKRVVELEIQLADSREECRIKGQHLDQLLDANIETKPKEPASVKMKASDICTLFAEREFKARGPESGIWYSIVRVSRRKNNEGNKVAICFINDKGGLMLSAREDEFIEVRS